MEVDGQNVLVMAEKVRRRASKWDVGAEHHVETEIRIGDTLPVKVDTSINLTELDSKKPNLSISIDSFEADQSANQSVKVSDNNIMQSELLFEMPQIPEQIDMEDEDEDGFKKQYWEVPQERTMVESVENNSREVLDNNIMNSDIMHSDVLCEMNHHSEHIDLESDRKDDFKKQDLEQASQEQTLAESVENQEKPFKGDNEVSPGPDESSRWIHSISPIDVRNKSDRKRSRSRSRSRSLPYESRSRSRSWSRTKSPSYVYKQDSERSTGAGRTRGSNSPCRDFAAGRCRHGSECRFLHEGGGSKQVVDRHYDSGSMDGRGSRVDKINYSRENSSRRHDGPHEDGRENNEQYRSYKSTNPCFDFTKGRCQRGASCRYVHHDAPSDGGWNARDESREKVHDRWGGNGNGSGIGASSFSQRPAHRRVNNIPCRFFLENRCRNGENCSFYHQIKPDNIPTDNSVQMQQQIMNPQPQNLQNQFPAFHQPPNSHFFNPNIQNQTQNPPSYEQVQQNLLNLNGNIQQIVPPIHNSQVQIQQNPDFNAQVQQNLLMQSQNENNYNVNGKIIQQNVPPIQNFNVVPNSDAKPSQINPDEPVTNKVVTSEQAAKIGDLSASLAQFFGSTAVMAPQPFLNPTSLGPFVTTAAPFPPVVGIPQANLNRPNPLLEKPRVPQIDSSAINEARRTETTQVHKEQIQQLVNDDSKKMKEAKDFRMFKCALIEFVKDILKPKWKEGQLSKEAHKTIVKKVVEKVSGSLQGPNVPQTQEKIDFYLASSKPKLSKLVQAYVEKYVKG